MEDYLLKTSAKWEDRAPKQRPLVLKPVLARPSAPLPSSPAKCRPHTRPFKPPTSLYAALLASEGSWPSSAAMDSPGQTLPAFGSESIPQQTV